MQIVIDIPEKTYVGILEAVENEGIVRNIVYNAIANGTPLPKGHGRLIDRNKLIRDGINKGFCDWYDEIKQASTIIETDKTESEGKE